MAPANSSPLLLHRDVLRYSANVPLEASYKISRISGVAMDGRWFYSDKDQAIGPFEWLSLIRLASAGLINPTTWVWREGDPEWITLENAMLRANPLPPPLPSSADRPQSLSHAIRLERSEPATDASQGWLTSPPSPWRRYGARMLDTTVHGWIGVMIFAFIFYSVAPLSADAFFNFVAKPEGLAVNMIMTCFLAALIGGIVVGATGSSLGKAVFGIKVRDHTANVPGVLDGTTREFKVWFYGMGLGIPLVALFAMFHQFKVLKEVGSTSWDKNKFVVSYRPPGPFQTAMNVVGALMIFLTFALSRAIAATP